MVKASLLKRRSQNNLKKNSSTNSGDVKDTLNKSYPNGKSKVESSIEADPFHDAFVNEYSITTNLYRYLAWRQKTRPIVLHRNLSFFRKNSIKKKRCSASLSEIIENLIPKAKPIAQTKQSSKTDGTGSFKFTFEGFFDSEVEKEWSTIEASLTAYVEHHWSHNRKKTSGRIIVPLTNKLTLRCNPGDSSRLDPLSLQAHQEHADDKETDSTIFLYTENSSSTDIASKIHSSFLVFKINASERKIYSKVYDSPPNRRKSHKRPDIFPVNYQCIIPVHYSSHKLLPNVSSHMNLKTSSSSYRLTPGTYEARLDVDVSPLSSSDQLVPGHIKHEQAADSPDLEWLNVNFGSQSSAISEYLRWPVIRFYVESIAGDDDDSANTKPAETSPAIEEQAVSISGGVTSTRQAEKSSISVTYRFLFHGEVGQWSEVKDLVCPWCRLDCGSAGPEGLLCHLNAFHPRFQFKGRVNRAGDRLSIRVWVKRDIEGDQGDIGLLRSTNLEQKMKPVKRAPCGVVLFYKIPSKIPKRPDPSKFPPYTRGHNRLYWHTWSSQPLRPTVFDYDSEEEDTLRWLHDHYRRNLHQFTDVNVGEMRIMQLWNSHLIRHNVVGDCQVNHAVNTFMQEHRDVIREENLRGNLLLHLANLADFGLLQPTTFNSAMRILDDDASDP